MGWLAADLWMNGTEVAQAPRNLLKKLKAEAQAKGYQVKTGVECEFFLTTPDGLAVCDAADRQAKPCYDQSALMRQYDIIAEISDAMLALGWKPYQSDHEDANGQFEMNWEYDDTLITADRHSFFKYMAKSIAEKHGLRATFMPKPFLDLTGSGCHAHVSLWRDGKNLFESESGELGVSDLGYHFIGGIIHSADALCALFNPTVNSYKRINAPRTTSGATWAPNTVTYTGNNRTHMIRIPEAGRFELRLADAAARIIVTQCDQGRGPDRDRIGTERKRLGDISAVADTTGYDQLDLAMQSEILQRLNSGAEEKIYVRNCRALSQAIVARAPAGFDTQPDAHAI